MRRLALVMSLFVGCADSAVDDEEETMAATTAATSTPGSGVGGRSLPGVRPHAWG